MIYIPNMKKGEIYQLIPKFKDLYNPKSYKHPFIFWEEEGINIHGIMITTSCNPKFSNKLFKASHFEQGYKITYGKSNSHPKSYFAPLFLLKKVKFNHLEKVGNLTPEGITHLESLISTLEFTTWENHMNKK